MCLEPHDLVLSKYVAGREKDRDYVRAAARHRLVESAVLLQRLEGISVPPDSRQRIRQQIQADFGL
jgi:hypothetical protein